MSEAMYDREDIYIAPELEERSSNIFANIPYDVLTYIINPLLTPLDRTAFNQVVEPRERISKRFPKDYAIQHHIETFITQLNLISEHYKYSLSHRREWEEYTIVCRFLDILMDPVNRIVFEYVEGLKESVLNYPLREWVEGILVFDVDYYKKKIVMKRATDARAFLEQIVFQRDLAKEMEYPQKS